MVVSLESVTRRKNKGIQEKVMATLKPIVFDARELTKDSITISVQVKNMWLVKIGLFFIKIGCWISGASYVNEFPMSLIQNNESVNMDDK